MLKNILSKSDCAECRLCCYFEHYELWEGPIVSPELRTKISARYPEVDYIAKGGSYVMKMEIAENGYYKCPVLSDEKGCLMGDEKPFDCRIWPFRVMRHGGVMTISVCQICPAVMKRPLEEIMGELNAGLADKILDYARCNPDIIKNYEPSYPILMVTDIPC